MITGSVYDFLQCAKGLLTKYIALGVINSQLAHSHAIWICPLYGLAHSALRHLDATQVKLGLHLSLPSIWKICLDVSHNAIKICIGNVRRSELLESKY